MGCCQSPLCGDPFCCSIIIASVLELNYVIVTLISLLKGNKVDRKLLNILLHSPFQIPAFSVVKDFWFLNFIENDGTTYEIHHEFNHPGTKNIAKETPNVYIDYDLNKYD